MVLLPPLIASKHNILLLQKGTMFSTAKDPTANRNMISILHRQGSVLPTTYSFHNPLHYNCVPPQNEGALIQATVSTDHYIITFHCFPQGIIAVYKPHFLQFLKEHLLYYKVPPLNKNRNVMFPASLSRLGSLKYSETMEKYG